MASQNARKRITSVGALVLAAAVMRPGGPPVATHPQWRERLASMLSGAYTVHAGAILTTPAALDSVLEKAACFRRFGAVAVDMESASVAGVAAEEGVPFAALRVIVDTAQDLLPRSVVAASVSGALNVPRLLGGLLRSPADIVPLIRLARRYTAAARALSGIASCVFP